MLSMVSCHVAGDSVDVQIVHRMRVGSICCVRRLLTLAFAAGVVIVSRKETNLLMAAKSGMCHVMTKSLMAFGSLRTRNTKACPVTISNMAMPRNASRYVILVSGERAVFEWLKSIVEGRVSSCRWRRFRMKA